ncbi:hypothetical protein Hanom_Chr04g00313291 [Helianthus anomalus]
MSSNLLQLLSVKLLYIKILHDIKLPISHRDSLHLKYRSLTNIRYFTALTA